jgi:hypothetical protein
MKKILDIAAVILLLSLPLTGEELHPAHRIFELGIDVQAGASNSYFAVKDFLVKDLVIDLRKIADEMPSEGLLLNAYVSAPGTFMNLNLPNGMHFGISNGIEGNANINIGKGMFEFLGYGNSGNSTITVDGSATADVFSYYTLTAGLKLKNNIQITVSPSLVIPLVHAETTSLTASFSNPEDGSIMATAVADGTVYSFTDMSDFSSNSNSYEEAFTRNALASAGFDLGATAEMPVFSFLQTGAYIRLPFVPGHLKYTTSGKASLKYTADNMSDLVNGNAVTTTDITDIQYGTANYAISRPLRFGTEAAFRPFGNWFTISGLTGAGIKYPYTDKYKWYPEYSIGMNAVVLKYLGLTVSSSYLSEIFIQEVNIMINCRVLEINTAVLFQSADFVYSFRGAGAGARISVCAGY